MKGGTAIDWIQWVWKRQWTHVFPKNLKEIEISAPGLLPKNTENLQLNFSKSHQRRENTISNFFPTFWNVFWPEFPSILERDCARKSPFPKDSSCCFYVFYDCSRWYTDNISGSKPPWVCPLQLFKLCNSFFGEFWRKVSWIWPSRQKYYQKTAIFAFSKLEKAIELPRGSHQSIYAFPD